MIAQLRGTLLEKGIDELVIEVGGVGLRVNVSLSTLAEQPAIGQATRLLTYLQVREDALTLFGFATQAERTAFELCIGVQQVGPKLAMSILSTLTPSELLRAVRAEDHARLRRIPGVGMKTAERLVLELRDKIEKAGLGGATAESAAQSDRRPDRAAGQVVSALINLGYRQVEAERAAEAASSEGAGLPVADLVKKALRILAE